VKRHGDLASAFPTEEGFRFCRRRQPKALGPGLAREQKGGRQRRAARRLFTRWAAPMCVSQMNNPALLPVDLFPRLPGAADRNCVNPEDSGPAGVCATSIANACPGPKATTHSGGKGAGAFLLRASGACACLAMPWIPQRGAKESGAGLERYPTQLIKTRLSASGQALKPWLGGGGPGCSQGYRLPRRSPGPS